MPSHPLLRGKNHILPALVTPLLADGSLDVKSTERLIEHLYAKGVGGLYVTGSTGEGVYLDADIRRKIVEMAVHLSGNHGTVIAHVGAVQTSLVIDLAKHAGRAGAHGVSSIPPFVGGFSWGEVSAYYQKLCQESPLPVVAYHIPGITGKDYGIENMASLLKLKNLAGYKLTDTNFYVMQRLVARLSPEQLIYNGPDEMLALGLQMGAKGGIGTTYNFMPELILKVYDLYQKGDFAASVEVQKQVNEIIEILLSYQGLAASKMILYWQGLIDNPLCVFPRAPMTQAERTELRERLGHTVITQSFVR